MEEPDRLTFVIHTTESGARLGEVYFKTKLDTPIENMVIALMQRQGWSGVLLYANGELVDYTMPCFVLEGCKLTAEDSR